MERTDRQKAGDAAECLVAERLAARGWLILARNVHAAGVSWTSWS
jgi:Holliday junction resolvase-like predicted endonuclease